MKTKTKPAPKAAPQRNTNRSRKVSAMGAIQADLVYPQHVFCKLLGITRFAIRDMRKRGLKVRKDGRYSVIRGSDYLEYVESLPEVGQKNHDEASVEVQAGSTLAGGDGAA